MPLGVLNNISAIYAENNLNQTQASLQNTLTQLSSGSRINSGADDSAGLAIANGLQANSSALTQSSANATAGVGFLQVADGALSQVTNLLNRAVTLATEAGGGTLSGSQMSAADQEYQDILTQIGTIGSTTEYNNIQVFSAAQTGTKSNIDFGANTPAASGFSAVSSKVVTDGDAGTITTGNALSGSLVIKSVGGTAAGSATVNLANYQGLASSNSSQQEAALKQLGDDLTAGLGAKTGSTYTAALSNTGVLSITTSNATQAAANVTFTADAATGTVTSSVLPTDGVAVSGSLNLTSTIPSVNSGAAQNLTIDLSDPAYAGLTSSDTSSAIAALNSALNDTTTGWNSLTNDTYTASITSDGKLQIVTSSLPVTPDRVNLAFAASTNTVTSGVPLATGDALGGTLSLSSTGGTAGGSQDITLSSYASLTSADPSAALTQLGEDLTSGTLGTATGSTYTATLDGSGDLVITSSDSSEVFTVASDNTNQQAPSTGETLAMDTTDVSNVKTNVGETLSVGNTSNVSEAAPTLGEVNIYTSDGTSTGSKNYVVTVGVLNDTSVGSSSLTSAAQTSNLTATVAGQTGMGGILAGAGKGTSLNGTDLTSQANAEAALQTVDNAISAVAYQRGQVGANINTLTAASNIASSEQTNITSAQNAITATDYASTTSNMSKYEILTQTGISALAQANSTQQMVTKLLQ